MLFSIHVQSYEGAVGLTQSVRAGTTSQPEGLLGSLETILLKEGATPEVCPLIDKYHS